jgi:hypothetical protein
VKIKNFDSLFALAAGMQARMNKYSQLLNMSGLCRCHVGFSQDALNGQSKKEDELTAKF